MRCDVLFLSGFKARCVGALTLVALAALGATVAQADAHEGVDAPDLDVVLERVRAEVDLLRFHMGKPGNTQGSPTVDDVQPHEGFLQAQNLFRKANRLARELVGAPRRSPPVAPPDHSDVMIGDIYDPLAAALEQILDIKTKLGITEQVDTPERVPTRDLTSVYRVMVQTNRQLNLMTESTFSAGDVYDQISLAITYAGGILSAFPETDPIPEALPFEAGKSPDDVYRQLSDCMRLNRDIANAVGLQLLRYDARGFRRAEALQSDVYDLATLLVSYISYVATRLEAPEIYPDIAKPKYVFPSHAYKHVGILRQQLTQILERLEQ